MVTSGEKKSSIVLDHCTGRSIKQPSHLAIQYNYLKKLIQKLRTSSVVTKIHVTHQWANALKILENNIDSATEDNNNSNNNLENSIEYTIDVTDALQCMVIHRNQSCGYIEIDDGFNKLGLEAFYNTYYDDNKFEDYIEEKQYLEIEYV
eukprot:417731_1